MEDAVTPESTGGVRSLLTVTETAAEVAVLPAASRATAVRVCEPFGTAGGFQATVNGATVTSAPRLVLSSLNWTPTTPTLSEAGAETVREPGTEAPAAGGGKGTAGGVMSGP